MMSKEKMMKRLAYLMDKHRVLDKKVTEDYKQMVSDAVVQQDKFEKVALKREIEFLQKQLGLD